MSSDQELGAQRRLYEQERGRLENATRAERMRLLNGEMSARGFDRPPISEPNPTSAAVGSSSVAEPGAGDLSARSLAPNLSPDPSPKTRTLTRFRASRGRPHRPCSDRATDASL